MSFPAVGEGLQTVRDVRVALDASDPNGFQQARVRMLQSDTSQDSIVSMQPQELPQISEQALADLQAQCAAIDDRKPSCCANLCYVPACICACLCGFFGLLVDMCCEGFSQGTHCMKSCAASGFRCCLPSKEDQKRALIEAKRSEYQITPEQERTLLGP